jgi:hypothetical protein
LVVVVDHLVEQLVLGPEECLIFLNQQRYNFCRILVCGTGVAYEFLHPAQLSLNLLIEFGKPVKYLSLD